MCTSSLFLSILLLSPLSSLLLRLTEEQRETVSYLTGLVPLFLSIFVECIKEAMAKHCQQTRGDEQHKEKEEEEEEQKQKQNAKRRRKGRQKEEEMETKQKHTTTKTRRRKQQHHEMEKQKEEDHRTDGGRGGRGDATQHVFDMAVILFKHHHKQGGLRIEHDLRAFADSIPSNKESWFVELTECALTSRRPWVPDHTVFDQRYFYAKDRCVYAVSGLVRDTMARILLDVKTRLEEKRLQEERTVKRARVVCAAITQEWKATKPIVRSRLGL